MLVGVWMAAAVCLGGMPTPADLSPQPEPLWSTEWGPASRAEAIEVCIRLEREGSAAACYAPEIAPMLESRCPQVREAAIRALGAMGPAALPVLVPHFGWASRYGHPAEQACARMGNRALGPLTALLMGDARAQHGAASALALLGPQGWRVLVDVLPRGGEATFAALEGLAHPSPGQWPVRLPARYADALLDARASMSHHERITIESILMRMDPSAAPTLRARMRDESPKVRATCITVLSRSDRASTDDLQLAAAASADPDASVRLAAAEGLSAMRSGDPARRRSALVALLSDAAPLVRRMAVFALAWPTDDPAIADAIGRLEKQDPDPGVRTVAYLARIYREGGTRDDVARICEAIATYSTTDGQIVVSLAPAALWAVGADGLDAMVGEATTADQSGCMWIAAGMGQLGECAVPSLLRIAGSVAAPYHALWALRGRGEAARPAFLEALDDPDPAVRLGAARVLGWETEPLDRGCVERLVRSMKRDPDEDVRLAAAMACIGQGRARERALLTLCAGRQPEALEREPLVEALVVMGQEGAPHLRRMLRSNDEGLQHSALRAVSRLDTAPEEVLRDVGALATRPACTEAIRRSAVAVLRMHREPSGWVLTLLKQVASSDARFREAWNGFEEYGAPGQRALEALLDAPDPEVRAEALRRLQPPPPTLRPGVPPSMGAR